MKQILLLACLSLTLAACTTGKPFFIYDEIDYYASNIDDQGMKGVYTNGPKSVLDSLKENIILDDMPKDLKNLGFIGYLEQVGFQKRVIDKSRFKAIGKIFSEKKVEDYEVAACLRVYRDILVFKRDHKVVGIAKICFECGGNWIVGTKANTINFGQGDDYERLYKILRE